MDDVKFFKLMPKDEEIGERIDKFLSRYLSAYSRNFIQNLIESGMVLAGDAVLNQCSAKVSFHEYYVTIPEPKKSSIVAKDIALDIIYEDDDLLVINKQHNLTTHPGAGNYEHTLVNALMHYLGDNLSSVGGVERPGIVHRLDKDTTGLMVVAKNDTSHRFLSEQLQSRSLVRIYHALCWKVPVPSFGVVTTYIRRCKYNRLKMEVSKTDGKLAVTEYRSIENFGNKLSLIECKLKTGRTHQIRVHMSHIGHPVFGDQIYANNYKSSISSLPEIVRENFSNFSRQALIAKEIKFIHPSSLKEMCFSIDYENEIKSLLDTLRSASV